MVDVIAGVTILVDDRQLAHPEINEVLSRYGAIIAGRMGIPHLNNERSVIALIVQGDEEAVDGMVCELTSVEKTKGFRTVLARFEE